MPGQHALIKMEIVRDVIKIISVTSKQARPPGATRAVQGSIRSPVAFEAAKPKSAHPAPVRQLSAPTLNDAS